MRSGGLVEGENDREAMFFVYDLHYDVGPKCAAGDTLFLLRGGFIC